MAERLALGGMLAVMLSGQAPPQVPPGPPFAETVHGETRVDPYRWMEEGGPAFDGWARQESAFARGLLDSLPGRAALHRDIQALDRPPAGIGSLEARGSTRLHERLSADGGRRELVIRRGDGAERPLDLAALLPPDQGPWSEVRHSRVLSPDGRIIAFGTTRRGEADPAIRFYDVEAGRLLPDVIDWPLWADSRGFRPAWLADSSGILYVRNPQADAAMSDRDRARRGQVFLHRLGSPRSADRALFGFGLTEGIDEADTLYVDGEPQPRWLALLRRQPEGRELWVADLQADRPALRRVHRSEVLIAGYGVRGNRLFTLDAAGGSRFRVLGFDLDRPDAPPEVVLQEQPGVLRHLQASADGVYVVEALLDQARLHVLDDGGHRVIDLPRGSVDSLAAGPSGRGAWLEITNWLSPRRGWLAEPGADGLRSLDPEPAAAAAPDANISELGWATARDGTLIPYTIVRRRDAPRDGSGFALMSGYGCFGTTNSPFYWPALDAWLRRGGLFVQVGMRGGGELGADWHRVGRDRNKPAAFEDAVDTARHLVRQGWTRPGRIGVTGGSCGGATMGMAALDAPELIGAAYLSVGAFDLGRMAETTTAGARSIRDFGDPATAEGWRRIQALSPYWQILPGADRPALLIGSGATDYTIPLWVGGKMVARARAANPEAPPILWRIDWTAGHNIGVDYALEDADLMAFMFWQLGHPDFQPRR